MIPATVRGSWARSGLLRTRGDDPKNFSINSNANSVLNDVVCSAHAEMILFASSTRESGMGLLRTRGDDPAMQTGAALTALSAPHTRR